MPDPCGRYDAGHVASSIRNTQNHLPPASIFSVAAQKPIKLPSTTTANPSSHHNKATTPNHLMQTIRINNRLPTVHRVCKVVPTTTPTRTMSLFPRFVQSEFAPMFRLLDDYSAHVANSRNITPFTNSLKSFNPRFDVKETAEGYTLEGELPGVEQKDVTVEWTDTNTLSIKGRSENRREEGTRPSAVEAAPEKAQITADAESNGSYHKATVEDEAGTVETNSTAEATPAASEAATETTEQPQQSQSRWWVSERSVGEFSRTFNFPNRVDQENVKASLKNGILSIVVPKASAPETRRINVE